MSHEQSGLLAAHRVAVGASVFAIVAAVVSQISAVIEILSAPAEAVRWAASGVIAATSFAWLVAVLINNRRVPRPVSTAGGDIEGQTPASSRAPGAGGPRGNNVLGFISLILLVAGCSMLGWNASVALADPARPPQSDVPRPPVTAPAVPRGTARIISPADEQEVPRCTVEVRFEGTPAPGKAFVVATKQTGASYYFESEVATDQQQPGQWSANVQLGQKKVSSNESYTISVYELDKKWAAYLGSALGNAAVDWDVLEQEDATYWRTDSTPPDAGAALSSIDVDRSRRDDPSCPT